MADPAMFEALAPRTTPSLALSTTVITTYERCLGSKAAAVDAVMQTVVKQGGLTQTQADCVAKVLVGMSATELPAYLANDKAVVNKYRPALQGCQPV